jgi:hypothetical protein
VSEGPADLGDGLVLRRGTEADAERAVELAREVLTQEDGSPDVGVVLWTGDLFERPPPGFSADLFTLVEDTVTGELVSMLCLIPQTWTYSGLPFGVGRIELVATRPAYRRRGLIRAQIDAVHRRSAEMEHFVQAITGVPWFYRRFGYDMALDLGGGRSGRLEDVPEAPADDPWAVRPAAAPDLEVLERRYTSAMERYLVACRRDEAMWHHDFGRRSPGAVYHRNLAVVERAGEPAGVLVYSGPERGKMFVTLCEIDPEAGWRAGILAALRYLRQAAGDAASAVRFGATTEHPAFSAARDVLTSSHDPYAWYVRVADLPAFLQRVAPVLEWNLAESPFAGHSATVRINLYTDGIWLRLEDGSLVDVGRFRPGDFEDGDAAFPDLSFLQMVFGRRTARQLRDARADCWFSGEEVAGLLDALFPAAPSMVYAVG